MDPPITCIPTCLRHHSSRFLIMMFPPALGRSSHSLLCDYFSCFESDFGLFFFLQSKSQKRVRFFSEQARLLSERCVYPTAQTPASPPSAQLEVLPTVTAKIWPKKTEVRTAAPSPKCVRLVLLCLFWAGRQLSLFTTASGVGRGERRVGEPLVESTCNSHARKAVALGRAKKVC